MRAPFRRPLEKEVHMGGLVTVLFILILLGAAGYAFYMYKKNETFTISELIKIDTHPMMPKVETSYFLKKTKEFTERGLEKVGEFSVENMPYPNYNIGFYSPEKNVYAIVTQNVPNQIQQILGVVTKPYMSVYTIFDDGSDLETTTRAGADKEVKSVFRRVNALEDLPIDLFINKHKEKIDFAETTGILEYKIKKENLFLHYERGLRIDIMTKSTNGYVTKTDVSEILRRLKIDLKKKEENKEENKEEEKKEE